MPVGFEFLICNHIRNINRNTFGNGLRTICTKLLYTSRYRYIDIDIDIDININIDIDIDIDM